MKCFIGFVAEKESGKTTTFDFIKDQIHEAQEIMLAEHLKESCAKVFKLPLINFESQKEKEKPLNPSIILNRKDIMELGLLFEIELTEEDISKHLNKELKTTRQVLQYVGTDIMRAIEDDIHLKWAMRRAPESNLYVITDIRFPNEFDFFCKYQNFFPFYIDRKKERVNNELTSHASESHIQELRKRCLAEIDNNHSLKDLKDQVESLIVPMVNRALKK